MATYEDDGGLGRNSIKFSQNSDTQLSCDEPLLPLPAFHKDLICLLAVMTGEKSLCSAKERIRWKCRRLG